MIEWIASGFVFEKCFFSGRDLWKQSVSVCIKSVIKSLQA